MDKTSPREILLVFGKWIGSTDFAKLVAEKKNVSERQAKNLISQAYRHKEIRKHIFSDRTVIYGLAEFGPPTNNTDSENYTYQQADLQDPKMIPNKHFTEIKFLNENILQEKGQLKEIITIIEELQDELSFFREPTINEIALRASIAPEILRPFLMTLAAQQKWKIQSQQQAESKARDAINLAGWLDWNEKDERNPSMEGLYRLD